MPREIKSEPEVETSTSFDGKHVLEYKDSSHRYKLNGKPCVGVTTFIKASYPVSQGLISWQKGQALEHLWNATVGRTVELSEKAELFKAAKMADKVKAQEAADVGTILHSLAELRGRGRMTEADVLLEKARAVEKWPLIESCYTKFLAWEKQNDGEMVESEALVASPTHLYCGKLDLLSRRNGVLVLSDYKTSKAIFSEQKIQLAAYRRAVKEWLGLDVGAIEIIRFGKESGDFETEYIDDRNILDELDRQAVRCRETFEFVKLYDISGR